LPVISRYDSHSLRFDCYYSRESTNVTTENYITPNIVHTHFFDGTNLHEGSFTYTFQFTQSDYDTPLPASSTIEVDDWMYLTLTLDDGSTDGYNKIAFKQCSAHNSPTLAASSLVYTIIDDYCVKDMSWDQDNSIELTASGSSEMATMRVKSFIWNNGADDHQIYITCEATVCNSEGIVQGTTDQVTCNDYTSTCASATTNKRRRRRRKVTEEIGQVVTLMTGPMEIN